MAEGGGGGWPGLHGLRVGVCGGLTCAAPVYHFMCCNLWGSRRNYTSLSACVCSRRWAEDSAGRCVFRGLFAVCVCDARMCMSVWGREDEQPWLWLSDGNFLVLSHSTALLPALTSTEDEEDSSSHAHAQRLSLMRKQTKLCLRLPNAASKLGGCWEREAALRSERVGSCRLRRVKMPERARRHVWKRAQALRRRRP